MSTNRIYGKYLSLTQKDTLLSLMESNLALARNQFSSVDGKTKLKEGWEEIAQHLNALGGAKKNGDQWRKCWDDIKARVKQKSTAIKKIINQTGSNGKTAPPEFSEYEKRVIAVMSTDAINGDKQTKEIGFGEEAVDLTDVIAPFITSSRSPRCSTPANGNEKRKRRPAPTAALSSNDEYKYMEECLKIKRQRFTLEQRKVERLEEDIKLKKELLAVLQSRFSPLVDYNLNESAYIIEESL